MIATIENEFVCIEVKSSPPIKRVYEKEDMFSINNEIFIINSKPDLISNSGKCFSIYFAEKGISI